MYEYLHEISISSWEEFNNYSETYIKSFLNCNRTTTVFRHIETCGCADFDRITNRFSYYDIIGGFYSLFQNPNSNREKEFIENSSFANNLINIWRKEGLGKIDLTPVGITLATTFCGAYCKHDSNLTFLNSEINPVPAFLGGGTW